MIDITPPSTLSPVTHCPASLSDTRRWFLGPTHLQTLLMCFWDLIGEFLIDSSGIKASGVLSRMCSALTDLQLASSTPASASSLSRVGPSQLVQPTDYQLAVTLVWVPSLCVVRADYKLARQLPPELKNVGTEPEQRSTPYRSQISHLSRSMLNRIREISQYHLELFSFILGAIYIHTHIIGCPCGCCCLCIVNILITITIIHLYHR